MFGHRLIPNEFFRAESNSFLFHSNSAIFGHFLVKNEQKWGIMLTNLKQIRFHFVCGIGTGGTKRSSALSRALMWDFSIPRPQGRGNRRLS